ncbi:hypothetical protein ACSBR2_024556 [Camellia fascicularis]
MSTATSFLFLFLAVVSLFLAKCRADPYGNPSPPVGGVGAPPPDAVAGKQFPQSFSCDEEGTRCLGLEITWPQQCPQFKPSNTKTKGCFIDCNL